MEFLDPKIDAFVTAHTDNESEVLQKLNRDTHAKVLMPRMLSGHLQGRVLSLFSLMIQPQYILEIGTYTGYSGICLSEGLQENGTLYTIDINEELESMTRQFFDQAGISKKVKYLIGNALEIIPTLEVVFDMVFIDADKENYSAYYDLVFDKVRQGGYIIADNVLWSGKVVEDYARLDIDTKALVDFCDKVQKDERVQNVLFPIRDGLLVARKK